MQNDKVSKFVDAISKEAKERLSEINRETEEYVAREMEKAENQALYESYQLIQRQIANIRGDIGRDLSRHQVENRKKLFDCRRQMMERVFKKAESRLKEYTGTSAYLDFLSCSVKKGADRFGGKPVTVYHRVEDALHSKQLEAAAGVPCTFIVDDAILLGGIRLMNEDGTLSLDDTLDTRLNEQKEWFRMESGLTIDPLLHDEDDTNG